MATNHDANAVSAAKEFARRMKEQNPVDARENGKSIWDDLAKDYGVNQEPNNDDDDIIRPNFKPDVRWEIVPVSDLNTPPDDMIRRDNHLDYVDAIPLEIEVDPNLVFGATTPETKVPMQDAWLAAGGLQETSGLSTTNQPPQPWSF